MKNHDYRSARHRLYESIFNYLEIGYLVGDYLLSPLSNTNLFPVCSSFIFHIMPGKGIITALTVHISGNVEIYYHHWPKKDVWGIISDYVFLYLSYSIYYWNIRFGNKVVVKVVKFGSKSLYQDGSFSNVIKCNFNWTWIFMEIFPNSQKMISLNFLLLVNVLAIQQSKSYINHTVLYI